MPIIKSAKKRVRVANKAAIRNSKTKRSLKGAIKSFQAAVTGGKGIEKAQAKAQAAIDTAVKKGVIHKNKAARQKKALAAKAKAAGAKPTKKTTAKKAPAKTPTAKPAAKKAVAKKPAAKKPTAKK